MSRRLVDGTLTGSNGRDTNLNEDIIKQICDAVKLGCFPVTAALYAKINPYTFARWMRRGVEEPDSIYGALVSSMRHTLGEAEMRDLAALETFIRGRPAEFLRDEDGRIMKNESGVPIKIRDEIKPNLNAIMFKMDRRWQERWGKVVKFDEGIDVLMSNTKAVNEDVNIDHAIKERDRATHVLKQLAKAGYLDDDDKSDASE